MKTIQAYLSGMKYAFELTYRKKLYAYFLPSIFLAISFYYIFSSGQRLGNSMAYMEDWWLVGSIVSASKSFFSFLSFMFFEFFILVLLSPVNAYMAEKAKADITGEPVEFDLQIFIKALGRMVMILLVGFTVQFGLMFFLWIFSFLLGDLFYEIASMINIAFFVGFSFFDFSLELDEVSSSKSWKWARKNLFACILIGLSFNICVYYPQEHNSMVIYLIAISLLPNILTIASTKMYYSQRESTKENLLPHAQQEV